MNTAAQANTLPAESVGAGLPAGYLDGNQSLAISIARAEIDQQIATARAFPRSIAQAMKNILALATLDEETAKECIYALPRGGKPIRGPSARFAEIVQSQWGNNRVGTRVVHVDRIEKYVEAEGVFHDLESNSARTARVRRRLSDKRGEVLNEDMIVVTGNAAASISARNATLAGVPKAVWRQAYQAVEHVLIGDVSTMVEKRQDALKAFAGYGITPEQIYEVLEIGGLEDIGPDEYTTLVGMHQAIRSNEATVEEMFPPKRVPGQKGDKPKDLKSRLDNLAGNGPGASAETKTTQETNSSATDIRADEGSEGGAATASSTSAAKPSAGTPPAQTQPADGTHSAPTRNHAAQNAGAEDQPSEQRSSGGNKAAPGATPPGAADEAAARAAGATNRKKGMSRKAVPAEYRKGSLLTAYLDGFDTGTAEDREPGSEEE